MRNQKFSFVLSLAALVVTLAGGWLFWVTATVTYGWPHYAGQAVTVERAAAIALALDVIAFFAAVKALDSWRALRSPRGAT